MPANLRDPLLAFFYKLRQAREISFVRDAVAAENLLDEDGYGMVIMGDAHAKNLRNELLRACAERTSRPAIDAKPSDAKSSR